MRRKILFLIGSCSLLIAGSARAATYVEVNGIVLMEAENAGEIDGWTPQNISNSSGETMRDSVPKNQGHMKYTITFTRTGNYFVWFSA